MLKKAKIPDSAIYNIIYGPEVKVEEDQEGYRLKCAANNDKEMDDQYKPIYLLK